MEIAITGGIIALLALAKLFYDRMDRRFTNHLIDLKELYRLLNTVERETGVDGSAIFSTANSGSKPAPGVPLYIRVALQGPNTEIRELYNNVSLGEDQVIMLLDLRRAGIIVYRIEDMPYSIHQEIYIGREIKSIMMFFIFENQKSFYFGILESKESDTFDNPHDNATVKLIISKIRYIFKRPRSKQLFFNKI